jgi:tRNA-dihydrouridine synthase A
MQDVVSIPVTVKHRIGIDKSENYEFVRDFVGVLARAGCQVFIVHARSAWLKGLSPKENREIPPLRYDFVYRLKSEFPHLTIVLNGAVKTNDEISAHLKHVDGVMLGREAYHNPWLMSEWDERFFGAQKNLATRDEVEERMLTYIRKQISTTESYKPAIHAISRHMLGLRHGEVGARAWRQNWSSKDYQAKAIT